MNKLLLVDGSNLHFQMFFGMPARIINKQGKAIQGVLGFIGALNKIIKLTNPTHVCVLFDGECENERKELDQNYKANRVDYSTVCEEENPFTQLPYVYDCLDYMQIKRYETTFCETDDVIASYVKKYSNDMQIVISSFDSDFFQLISDNVKILRYRGDKSVVCDREYLQEKFQITANLYADFKSLTGDSADNIKGAFKVGPKTASQLVNEFGGINQIISRASEIKNERVKNSILEASERLLNNYKLIKLGETCCLPYEINQLNIPKISYSTKQVLTALNLY